MATLASLVDDILSRLQDDETLFSRAEIVRWLSEAYRRMTYAARPAKTFTAFDLPPRHTSAIMFDWERHFANGSYRKWTFTSDNGHTECTFLWEVQQNAGVANPTNGTPAVSNLWELAYVSAEVDTHYRIMLPKEDKGVIRVWHDHQSIAPATAKQFDSTETEWWRIGGEPYAWSQTLGNSRELEIYEIETAYYQSFEIKGSDQGQPRSWHETDHTFSIESGERSWGYGYSCDGESSWGGTVLSGVGRRFTFGPNEDGNFYTHAWEGDADDVTEDQCVTNAFEYDSDIEVGIFRQATSPDRQYFPSHQWQVTGAMRQAGKSEDAILVYHDVFASDLTVESQETVMIPDQLRKYLVYYALATLFNRQGEGYDPALASHYEFRASRGLDLLKKLANVYRLDESYVRGGGHRANRQPPLPQLPSNYPRAPWLR